MLKKSLKTILIAGLSLAMLSTVTASNHKDHKDIVGVASSAEVFKTLVAAVKAADLVEVLQGSRTAM